MENKIAKKVESSCECITILNKFQTCSKCKKKGATVGCEIKCCKKCYHYPCAIEAKAQTFEDKKKGRFGIYCFLCKDTQSLEDLSDEELASTSAHNPKRKLVFNNRQEEKTTHKRRRRISSNDSSHSDIECAPIESDFEENDKSVPDENEPVNGHLPVIASGTANQKANQGSTQDAITSTQLSRINTRQSQTSEVSIDSSLFWAECTSAGCAQVIFEDFINEMMNIFTRITSGQASNQDCDLALNVIKASGKLEELVAKQQRDLQKKLDELQQAARTLSKVALSLPRT
ncbi:hypothetical protein WMY93_028586 [Mugilogobius chulae]|uniref:PHD-type domain-containing protein n=1 Tax=Mugilogobius chulae TaxID=88201 RepID=A0AAW0MNP1_9GOBI